MKVNQTPLDEGGHRLELKFPPIDIMEELKRNECDFQTFDLITYDKDSLSVNVCDTLEVYVENEFASESETEPEIKISSPKSNKLVKRQNEIIK
jgi:hypothetical protein